MDLFKDFMGNTVDLDDMGVYPDVWKKMNIHELFSECMNKAGHSLFYMDFLHSSINYGIQRERVRRLCEELSDIWNHTRKFVLEGNKNKLVDEDEYRDALMNWLYRFQDEVENQC